MAASLRTPVVRLPLEEALGRRLSVAVVAGRAVPALPRAAMDGFAVRSADLATASSSNQPAGLSCVATVKAGTVPSVTLLPGEAVRIPTGGCVPLGADAVVPLESTQGDGAEPTRVWVCEPVPAGKNVVPAGLDFSPGEALFAPGRLLRAAELAALAALGITEVEVHTAPRVRVLSSGAEVRPPGADLGPAEVADSNQLWLWARSRTLGAEARQGGIVPDEPRALQEALAAAVATSDMVLISAGTSVGEHDFTSTALGALPGARLLFHGVRMRPGKPTLAALVERPEGACLVVGLPGFPGSAAVAFDVFVAPVLAFMQGAPAGPAWGGGFSATLAAAYTSAVGREDYLRVRVVPGTEGPGGSVVVASVAKGPSLVSGLLHTQGYVVVEEERERLDEGERVWVVTPPG